MLAFYSHLDDGALGPGVLEAPHVLVTALSVVGQARGHREKERLEKMKRENEKKAGRA